MSIFYLTQRASRSADSFTMEFPVDEILYMEDEEGELSKVNKAKKDIIEQVQKDYELYLANKKNKNQITS